MVRRFAVVEYPINGLLCLGEIEDAAGFGDQLLSDIECMLSQEWLPAGWGMSLAYGMVDAVAWPYEVSLTRSPQFADARILGVGPDALRVWDLLTEAPAMDAQVENSRKLINGRAHC
jgi:hypothetical protein